MEKKKVVMNDMVKTPSAPRRASEPLPLSKREKPTSEYVAIKTATRIEEPKEYFYEPERPVKNRSGCFLWMIVIICIGALIVGVGGLFTHASVEVVPKQFTGAVDTTISLSQSR